MQSFKSSVNVFEMRPESSVTVLLLNTKICQNTVCGLRTITYF